MSAEEDGFSKEATKAAEAAASRAAYAKAREQNSRPRTQDDPLRVAVLISGNGTNLQAILDASATGRIPVKVVLVISSRPDANGLKRAAKAGVPMMSLSRDVYEQPQVADDIIATECKEHGAEYIVMAGYMRLVGDDVLDAFPDHVVNLHPALLPSFRGAHAIRDAVEAGVKVTGVTVHFANAAYDRGAIIAQRPVAVREGDTEDTLAPRVHAVEHELYPWVLARIAAGEVSLGEDGKAHVDHKAPWDDGVAAD